VEASIQLEVKAFGVEAVALSVDHVKSASKLLGGWKRM
jgi:hypothetical protein